MSPRWIASGRIVALTLALLVIFVFPVLASGNVVGHAQACSDRQQSRCITETDYGVPGGGTASTGIAAGPDGRLWFTESGANAPGLGAITTSGVASTYTVPTRNAFPDVVALGPDGRMWFGEDGAGKLAAATTSGVITEYPVPADFAGGCSVGGSAPPNCQYNLARGSDGRIWFTYCGQNGDKVGAMTTSGQVTEYEIPGGLPCQLTLGADGRIWVADPSSLGGPSFVDAIDATGHITRYPLPSSYSIGRLTSDSIVLGPDHRVWLSVMFNPDGGSSTEIAAVSTSGQFSVYRDKDPDAQASPTDIVPGHDGRLWFDAGAFSNVTTGGVFDGTFDSPNFSPPAGPPLAVGADGRLWAPNGTLGSMAIAALSLPGGGHGGKRGPRTAIKSSRIDRTKRTAKFTFTAAGASGFQCALVKLKGKGRKHQKAPNGHFSSCRSPKTYRHLERGKFKFEVRALRSGRRGPVATKSFSI